MTRICLMELCRYWPGEGCMAGVMPCDTEGRCPAGRGPRRAGRSDAMTWREPVDMLLEPGDLLTISWSGELRTVIVAMDKEGDLILRDLTEAEAEALRAAEGGPRP